MNTFSYCFVEPTRKYAVFSGRAGRKEYWVFTLIMAIIYYVISLSEMAVTGQKAPEFSIAGTLFLLATLCPTIAVSVRRLHDRDKSGWLFLLFFLPLVGAIIMLALMIPKGTEGNNRFGPDPLAPAIPAIPADQVT